MKIVREGGYRGYLPIETLSMRRKDYDPFVEVAKVLAELREAIRGDGGGFKMKRCAPMNAARVPSEPTSLSIAMRCARSRRL